MRSVEPLSREGHFGQGEVTSPLRRNSIAITPTSPCVVAAVQVPRAGGRFGISNVLAELSLDFTTRGGRTRQ
jgi:hypothetical protein